MAVGQFSLPDFSIVDGVQLNAVSAGIKKGGQLDLVLIALPESAKAAGVFTQNAFCAAPVTLCKQHLNKTHQSRYLLINAGNANACTGDEGYAAALATCESLAQSQQVNIEQILPFSTGVIGERLPDEKIIAALPRLVSGLQPEHWSLAAQGIMTTDTRPKGVSRSITLGDETITINGIAKGAGMIKPNMATMLAYVATNARLSDVLLTSLVKEAADASFNRITIDGDTSTNDSCVLMATGQSSQLLDDADSDDFKKLQSAIVDVFQVLAQAIVKDGEGATKFVTIQVEQGANSAECLQVAYAIAHSPLVKTALFASDPNWGRIVAAIGYAGLDNFNSDAINVYLGTVLIVENGGRAASYSEDRGQAVMDQEEITIRVQLARGQASESLWTTDLSHDYVTINAEYRT